MPNWNCLYPNALYLWNEILFLFLSQYDKEIVVEAKFRDLENESCKTDQSNPSFFRTLKTNNDLLACKAEYYHQCGEYQKCFELTSV